MQYRMISDSIEIVKIIIGTIDLAVEGRFVKVTLPSHPFFVLFLRLRVLLVPLFSLVLTLHVVLVLDKYQLRVYPPRTS